MADKNKLAAGLQPKAKPDIQRGRGVQLSHQTDQPQADDQADERQADQPQADQPPAAAPAPATRPSAPAPATRPTRMDAPAVERVSRGYKLREDVMKACRMHATDTDSHLYEIMEEALIEYLQRNAPDLIERYNIY